MTDKGKTVISTSTKVEEDSFSWHLNGTNVLPKIKDQKKCGCCYAMAATSVCEVMINILRNDNSKINLAPQELVDCLHEKIYHEPRDFSNKQDVSGCMLSNTYKALDYIKLYGISFEEDYPFKAKRRKCRPPTSGTTRVYIKGYKKVRKDAEYMLSLIRSHPIACDIETYEEFDTLGNEIFEGPTNKASLPFGAHALLVVGYGIENGVEFYYVQNSWGTRWGVNGFGKIRRDLLYNFVFPRDLMLIDGAGKEWTFPPPTSSKD